MRMLHKYFLALLSLASSAAIAAPIPCPPIDFVKQHLPHVNTVQLVIKRNYAVYTGIAFYDSGSHLKWEIGSDTGADDFSNAYTIGKKNIEEATTLVYKFAEYLQDFWLCIYSNDNKTSVYAISKIHEPGDLMERVLSKLNE
jgi:hypothetical protein